MTGSPRAKTTIVCVTYNSADVIEPMLHSALDQGAVIIVDNCSTDDTRDRLAAYDDVTLIDAECNLGFGRACNLGAAAADTPYLLFLNPDATLHPGAVAALENFAEAHPDLGAANPRIETAAGRARLKMSSILPHPHMPRPDPDQPGQMPMLSGAALFVQRHNFEEIGGFDPAIFLYHEDHELCWRMRRQGFSLWHVPQAVVGHHAGTGSARSPEMARWKGYQMARSRLYVLRKTGQKGAFLRTIGPACLGLVSPLNFLSRRRRQKFIGQIGGALSALKDGGAFAPKAKSD